MPDDAHPTVFIGTPRLAETPIRRARFNLNRLLEAGRNGAVPPVPHLVLLAALLVCSTAAGVAPASDDRTCSDLFTDGFTGAAPDLGALERAQSRRTTARETKP